MKLFKKLLPLVLVLISALCLTFALSSCGENEDPPHTHTYGEWETVKDASCTDVGERKQTCSGCSDVKTERVSALGHTAPDADGKCERCKTVLVNSGVGETYTITVKDTSGAPIEGAVVQLYENTLGEVNKTTGADGKVSFTLPENPTFPFVKLLSLPESYKTTAGYDTPVILGAEKNIVITNGEKLTLYKLIIKDESGNTVSGVRAQICVGDNCNPGVSDENGVIIVYLSASDITEGVKASVTDEAYTGATVGRDYAYYSAGETSLIIVVKTA